MPPFQPKSILCPIDLSPASGAVLRWAGVLASTYDATLHILHAAWVDYPPYFLPSQEAELAASAARHRRFLDFTVIGSTTEKVMRHADADAAVLVLPTETN